MMTKTNINSIYKSVSPLIYFNNNLTVFSFQFSDKDFYSFYDETYFTFELSSYSLNNNYTSGESVEKTVKIILKNCSDLKHYFVNNLYNFSTDYDFNELYNSLCIVNNNIPAGGAFNSEYFYNLNMKFVKCDNKTSNNTCKSKEEIDRKIAHDC